MFIAIITSVTSKPVLFLYYIEEKLYDSDPLKRGNEGRSELTHKSILISKLT